MRFRIKNGWNVLPDKQNKLFLEIYFCYLSSKCRQNRRKVTNYNLKENKFGDSKDLYFVKRRNFTSKLLTLEYYIKLRINYAFTGIKMMSNKNPAKIMP